ncbi:MAG: thioester reductase domain-containing protein [Chitinophagales bacterium]
MIKGKSNSSTSPKKRYILRLLELSKSDPQIAALQPLESLMKAGLKEDLTLDRLIATYLDGYAERPALAERSYELIADTRTGKTKRNYLPQYTSITYQTLHDRIKALANSWRHHSKCRVAPHEFVCIMGFTSIDFTVLDTACNYAQAVTIPLQSSTSGADLGEIFANTQPVALAATLNDLILAAKHAVQHPSIRSLIAFNYDPKVDSERAVFEEVQSILQAAKADTQLIALNDLIDFGKTYPWTFLPPSSEGEERMAAILHSSGSTGKPKGAVISEKAIKYTWRVRTPQMPKITVMFAPQNHIMGRNTLMKSLNIGGTAYFTLKPDMSTLFEDIRLARPTFLVFFPRIFELIHQYYQNEVARRVRAGQGEKTTAGEQLKAEMKFTYLGDRLRGGFVGSAPTSAAVMEFVKDCFDILLMDGYGNTESGNGMVTIDGIIQRETVLDYKLRDVPELGYYTTDKPFPRGELCFKGKYGITRYYKQPEATKGLFDEEGYSRTGDIVEERAPDYVVVIDRLKDVIKLSQGEYVAIGVLGTVFEAQSAVIQQVYIYGNSHRAYLLAVIVPDREVAQTLLGGNVEDAQLRVLLRSELQKVAQNADLKSFEVPRDFIVESEPFSQKNGLLSSVRKRLRPALKRKYKERLEALYTAHEHQQTEELNALKDPNSSLKKKQKLVKLLEANLSIKDLDISKPRTFNELGGDSLGAALFSMSIEEIFGVAIPANILLSPTGSLQSWAKLIEKKLQNTGNDQATFASIHGKNAGIVYAKDLKLAHFLDKNTLEGAATAMEFVHPPQTVLLTGANGFLGHILCLQWLERLSTNGGKLICLIRAKDDAAARQRLDVEFEGGDKELELKYKELAANHLEVLAGDVSEAYLGLKESDFERLSIEVDRICHPAALVNHRLGYPHLFGPNVVGTAEMIRLALTSRKKPIDFVSSVAVERFLDTSEGNTENSPLLPQVKLSNQYAAGYGTSKWAAEHLLQQASQDFDLPINTFRCDMILADQNLKGQINAADMFTRLLYSVIVTGLSPKSFYRLNPDNSRAKAHYDGLPVDVISAVIVNVCDKKRTDYTTFNVQNYHQNDGISLDSFVDWIETAGYPIHRIANHSEWFKRLKDKLKELPEAQRQHSALEILSAYSRPYPAKPTKSDCRQFKDLVGKIPSLSEAFIHKCLEDMRGLGMIEVPDFVR